MSKFKRTKKVQAPIDTSTWCRLFKTDEELIKEATVARLLKNYRKTKLIPKAIGRNNVASPCGKSSDGRFTVLTLERARVEDGERAELHGASEATFPAYLLRNSKKGKMEGSLASARFKRWLNIKVSGQVLPFVRQALQTSNRGAVHATLIPNNSKVHVDDIHSIDFKSRKLDLSKNFQRAGVTAVDGIMVGAWDADVRGQYLRPHVHLIVTGAKVQALEKLRGLACFKPTAGNPKPIVLTAINDPRRQVGYCIKTYWGEAAYDTNKDGSVVKYAKGNRIAQAVELACLEKLHNTALSDFLILSGARLGAKGLVPTLGRSGKK